MLRRLLAFVRTPEIVYADYLHVPKRFFILQY
jgi:hypothetical protein